MITQEQLSTIHGTTVYDADGDKIGKAGDVYLDDATGRPEWLTVNTGLFGTHESFVPLEQATLSGDEVRLPFDKAKVKNAPRVAADSHLEPAEEEELYRYYGISTRGTSAPQAAAAGVGGGAAGAGERDERGSREGLVDRLRAKVADRGGNDDRDLDSDGGGRHAETTDTAAASGRNEHGTVGHDVSGPTTDSAMTRSEEELRVGTQTRESGRARLRKYVVTERQTQTVPVSHEEVRLEREPITEANAGAAMDGPAISEEEHEVVLREEVPVVSKEARPVERVRVDTETVTEQQQVSADVRKERIELERDTATGPRGVDTER